MEKGEGRMKILVTGGAGYIGSVTVRELIRAGYDVVVADDLSAGFRQAVHPRAGFYRIDIRDRAALDGLFAKERIDGVLHFAGFSEVGESMRDPLGCYDRNLGGTLSLLETMAERGVSRLVFSSSAAVYGLPERLPIREEDRTSPVSPYGETKLAAERLLDWAGRAGLTHVSLRYFNACGADPAGDLGEAHHPETHLIPLILQVPNGQRDRILVFGDDHPTRDGTCVRDYVHVSDLARAHILALDYLLRGGESQVFNLGSGRGYTVREVIEAARTITGRRIPTETAPGREGDPPALVASPEKARRVLGWKPDYDTIEEMISSAWSWHRKHPDGYR